MFSTGDVEAIGAWQRGWAATENQRHVTRWYVMTLLSEMA